MECLFCSIAKKEIPSHMVYEDGAAAAFLDIHPRAPGHTIVVPKRHAETILEVPESDIGPLFGAVKKVARMVKHAFGSDGLTIGINHGKASGQVVEHLHIHIVPRFFNDRGISVQGVVERPSEESLEAVALKIKNANNKIQSDNEKF